MYKVGINGFGRIGRLVLRSCLQTNIKAVAINDAFLTADYMVYLFKYDSTHGNYPGEVVADDNYMKVDGKLIEIFREKDPNKIPWKELQVDFVVECTGIFTTLEKASLHLNSGAKYVILTSPSSDIPMFVMGVNHKCFNPKMRVISTAGSTTNCLAPLAKVINDNFNIVEGLMMAVQSVSPIQNATGSEYNSKQESRSALSNIIPACSGAAVSIGNIIPELNGKLTGMAMKVPVADVSVLDLTVHLGRETTYEELKSKIQNACREEMKGIMSWTNEDVVSSDFIGNPHSCIFDVKSGIPLNKKFIKLVAWYDNEFAYSKRIAEMIEYMASVIQT